MSEDALWDAHEVRATMDSFAEADPQIEQAGEAVRESEQGAARASYELQSVSADLATAAVGFNEICDRVARLLDAESDGTASDYREYARAVEDHAVNINQSAAFASQATDDEAAALQIDYIQGEVEQVRTAVDAAEQSHGRAGQRVREETAELPEKAGIVQLLCDTVKARADDLAAWWADVKWKRSVLAENRERHLMETVQLGREELSSGRMPDYSDPQAFYDDKERIQQWSQEDDETIAAARAAQAREEL